MKKIIEKIFTIVHPALKPNFMQVVCKKIGIKLPSRFALLLEYDGKIDFVVNNQKITLQSYNTPVDVMIFWYGIFGLWEREQLRFWSKEVLHAEVILDVGANSGVYSLIASTNTKAKIYAFEPVPVVREMFLKNISLNNFAQNITVHEYLVGDKVGQETLFIPREGWVDVSSIDKSFAEKFALNNKMQELVCPMTTIDTYIENLSLHKDTYILAKIDVEGAEERVLSGMKNTLEKYNFAFTAELLSEIYFNEFVAKLPTDYTYFAIDEKANMVYRTEKFVTTASNYFFTKNNLRA